MRFDKLEDIINFAIGKEQEAVDFYTDLAGKVNDDKVMNELMEMAAMEEQHRDWLMNNSVSLAGASCPINSPSLGIADYTVEPEPTPDMAWHDIVNMAMHREASAMSLYNNLAQLVADPSAHQMFLSLAAEESRHKLYFETIWDDEVLIED